MQAADLFEPFKVIGTITPMIIHGTDSKGRSAKQLVKVTIEQCTEKIDSTIILFHIESLVFEDGEAYINRSIAPYVDPSVSVISDGKNYILLRTILDQLLGDYFIIEEAELRKIKNITPKQI